MTSIAELFALQQLDASLDNARAALADAESGLGETEELVAARAGVDERREVLRAAEHRAKESEFEADEQRRKIEPLEQRLYSGLVLNPKELEDLQQDIDSLKRRRSALDEEALTAMEALEQAQRELSDAETHLRELNASWEGDQQGRGARQTGLDAEIREIEGQREEQAQKPDSELLRLYEQLRASRGGRVVVQVEGGACQGCRISLPSNVIHRARGGSEVVQCSSCQRILYVS